MSLNEPTSKIQSATIKKYSLGGQYRENVSYIIKFLKYFVQRSHYNRVTKASTSYQGNNIPTHNYSKFIYIIVTEIPNTRAKSNENKFRSRLQRHLPQKQVKDRLNSANTFKLTGVNTSHKSSYKDLDIYDGKLY